MIEKAIYDILSSVAALSGVNIAFGIEPGLKDGGIMANDANYIVYYRNTTEPFDTKTGRSTLDEATIQVNIFSHNSLKCADLSEIVRGNLDRKSGTFNSVKVQSSQFINQVSLFEFNETYNQKGLYQMTQFYQFRVEPKYQ
jgi:hypothetical protein